MNRLRRMTLYEHRGEPLLARREFLRRLAGHGLLAVGVVSGSLTVGVLGYHFTEGFTWLDSLLNASMILGGMGPVDRLHTIAGKVFASLYALFSGMVFIVAVGILVAPLAHRALHRLHLEAAEDESAAPLP